MKRLIAEQDSTSNWDKIKDKFQYSYNGNAVDSIMNVISEQDWQKAYDLFKQYKPQLENKTLNIKDLSSTHAQNATMDLEGIVNSVDNPEELLNFDAPFIVYRYNGNDILMDGNKRATLLQAFNINTINAQFADLDNLQDS